MSDKAPRLHTCCQCGRTDVWGPGWGWWHTFVWCSDACELAWVEATPAWLEAQREAAKRAVPR